MVTSEWKELLQINRHMFRRLYHVIGINPSKPLYIKKWSGYFTHNKMRKELPIGNFKHFLLMPPPNHWSDWRIVDIEPTKFHISTGYTYFRDKKSNCVVDHYYRVADFENQRKKDMDGKVCYIISQEENDMVTPKRAGQKSLTLEEGLVSRFVSVGQWTFFLGNNMITSVANRSMHSRYLDKSGYYKPLFGVGREEKLAALKKEKTKEYIKSLEFMSKYDALIRKVSVWHKGLVIDFKYSQTEEQLRSVENSIYSLRNCKRLLENFLSTEYKTIEEVDFKLSRVEKSIEDKMPH